MPKDGKLYYNDEIGREQIRLLKSIKNNIQFFFWFFIGWWLIGIPVMMFTTSLLHELFY